MKRNYGIDLLRITAMGFVAGLHIIGIGGIITGSELLSGQFLTAQLLKTAMLCAVNCYALISGFVGWDRSPKLSALGLLWLKTLLFCVGITAFFALSSPLDWKVLLGVVFPVSTGQYWYLTAYVGLFVLMKLLNGAIAAMPKRELTWTLAGIFLLFSILPISPLTDAFWLHDGYSVLWLAVMYLLGGYLGKYRLLERLSAGVWMGIFAGSVVIAWAPRMLALWLMPGLWSLSGGNILIEYTSPTIVAAAVALLAVFARLRLPQRGAQLVKQLTPHAFGVYLFHAHPLMFRYVMEGRFARLGTAPIPVLIVSVLGAALVICAAGLAADWLVTGLLRLLKLDRLLKKLDPPA